MEAGAYKFTGNLHTNCYAKVAYINDNVTGPVLPEFRIVDRNSNMFGKCIFGGHGGGGCLKEEISTILKLLGIGNHGGVRYKVQINLKSSS